MIITFNELRRIKDRLPSGSRIPAEVIVHLLGVVLMLP